ncbi:MAG TPA: Qat anti-phage system associated protein QatB [Oscillatoriaceae cyanobacterium]
MERGLGYYVRKGLGGSPTATRRMAGTARTAGALYNVLQSMAAGQPPTADLNPAALRGQPPKAIGDRIINTILPSDGTQDAEANRQALANALSDMLETFPDADLTALTPQEIECWVEHFLGHSICHRIFLDVGKAIESKAPSTDIAVRRFDEMRDYVLATVAARAEAMRERGQHWTTAMADRFAARLVRETLDIFEEFH